MTGNAEALSASVAEGAFDACVCNYGILHLANPSLFLSEGAKVVRPGGKVAFTCWDAPPATAGMDIILQAVANHGNPNVPLPEGPPFFRFADDQTAAQAVHAAGLVDPRTFRHDQELHLSNPGDLYNMFVDGTARTRALLLAQTPEARRRIREAVTEQVLAQFPKAATGANTAFHVLPMPCVLTLGVRPLQEK